MKAYSSNPVELVNQVMTEQKKGHRVMWLKDWSEIDIGKDELNSLFDDAVAIIFKHSRFRDRFHRCDKDQLINILVNALHERLIKPEWKVEVENER